MFFLRDDPPSTFVLRWKTLGDVPRPRVIRDAFEELPDGLVDPTQASRIQISEVEIPKIRFFFSRFRPPKDHRFFLIPLITSKEY